MILLLDNELPLAGLFRWLPGGETCKITHPGNCELILERFLLFGFLSLCLLPFFLSSKDALGANHIGSPALSIRTIVIKSLASSLSSICSFRNKLGTVLDTAIHDRDSPAGSQ